MDNFPYFIAGLAFGYLLGKIVLGSYRNRK